MSGRDDNETELRIQRRLAGPKHAEGSEPKLGAKPEQASSESAPPEGRTPSGRAGGPVEDVDHDEPPRG